MTVPHDKSQEGFTIIELLVVVGIIALIAAATLVLLSNAQERGRDGRRLEDLRSIETGLNLYAAGNNGLYPTTASQEIIDGQADTMSAALIADGAMSNVPTDPHHPNRTYRYESGGSGNSYTLTFCLETETISGFSADCNNTFSQ